MVGARVDRVTGPRIVVFGDIANDIVVVPRQAIRPDTDTTSTIRPRPGGSAANTAAWLGSLGAEVDFVGCVGVADSELHAELLREQGVVPHLRIEPTLPTSTIVIIVEGDHRTMLTERGANAALAEESVTDELLIEAGILHLTGYNLLDGPRAAGVQRLIERAHAANVLVSLNPGSAGYIADFGPADFLAGIEGTDVLIANADEGALMCGETDPGRIARELGDRYGLAAITQGPRSVLIARRGGLVAEAAVPAVRVVDPTGAGDAMAAGFLRSWSQNGDPLLAAQAGIGVAARAVMVLGGRPPI